MDHDQRDFSRINDVTVSGSIKDDAQKDEMLESNSRVRRLVSSPGAGGAMSIAATKDAGKEALGRGSSGSF